MAGTRGRIAERLPAGTNPANVWFCFGAGRVLDSKGWVLREALVLNIQMRLETGELREALSACRTDMRSRQGIT